VNAVCVIDIVVSCCCGKKIHHMMLFLGVAGFWPCLPLKQS
jgi:hypothetical protein